MTARRLAAVPDKPQRVVLYVRVSAVMGRSGDDFHSPEVQTSAMRRLTAGMQEVEIVDDDIDRTGRDFGRDGIERVRQLAEAGAIDTMVVYNISRFGRNTMEGLQFLNWLADHGVTILSATEHIDTSTPSGRWMLTNLLAMAEMRSDEIGVEWGRIINRRAESGKPHGRIATGYHRGPDGRLVPDPATAPAITQAFIDYAAEDVVRAIRRRVRAATGLVLPPTVFKSMLQNPVYRGTVRVKGRGSAGYTEVHDAHPPLVDEETWQRAQARIARDRQTPARLKNPKYSLSGLIRCAGCGGRTNCRPDVRKPGSVKVACVKQTDLMGDCEGCGSPRLEVIEAVVLERVRVHIAALRGDVGAQAAHVAQARRASIDVTAVRDELDKTRRAMARTTERWAREQMDDRTYDDTMKALRAAESELAVAVQGLRETAERPQPGKLVALGEKLLELWPRMSGEQRNRALRDLVESVTIARSAYYRQPVAERLTVQWC